MNFSDAYKAAEEARETLHAADVLTRQIADLAAGRLRKSGVAGSTLTALKRELRDWNIHTYEWKPEK